MPLTTITATITGRLPDLEDINVAAIHHASIRRLRNDRLTVTYLCETADYDQALEGVMDCIDIERVEMSGCELVSIG